MRFTDDGDEDAVAKVSGSVLGKFLVDPLSLL